MNIVISQSDVKAWRFCKRQGKKQMETPRHEASGPPRVGQAFHAVMAAYGKHLVTTQQDSDVVEAESIVLRVAAQLSPGEAKDLQTFALQSCLEFPWAMVLAGKDHRFEERLFVTLEDTPRAIDARAVTAELANHSIFAGTPDITWMDSDGVLHIVDYKTGWRINHVSDPSENFQLNCYLAAMLASTGDNPAILHVYHARSRFFETAGFTSPDEPPKIFSWADVRVDWEAVKQAAQEMGAADDQTMTWGAHCVLCHHKVGCGAYAAHVFGVEESPTVEDALAELVNLKDRTAKLERRIKAELDDRRVIISGTHKAEYKERVTYAYGAKAINRLEEMLPRPDFTKAVSASTTNIKKVFARHKMADAVDAFAAEFGVEKKTSRLDVSQVGQRSDDEDEEP